jgi:hypothetical protein
LRLPDYRDGLQHSAETVRILPADLSVMEITAGGSLVLQPAEAE